MKRLTVLIILFIFIFIYFLLNIQIKDKSINYVYSLEYLFKIKEEKEEEKEKIIESFKATVTGYGPDCDGCIGITASGIDVSNNIYYQDKEYGKVRIVATDKKYPFGTIIKLSNIKDFNNIIAIVLDRGSGIGNNKFSQVDLLFESEDISYEFGVKEDVLFEVLRVGY